MKILIISFLLAGFFNNDSSFYRFNIVTINGQTIPCTEFKAKKVLITVVNANAPSMNQLKYLDSLQEALPGKLQVIAIPTTDFTRGLSFSGLKSVQSKVHFLIAQPLKVKKETGQDRLFNWLTHYTQNTHFDNNADGEGQVFLISENGILYSVLSSGVPNEVIGRLVNQKVN